MSNLTSEVAEQVDGVQIYLARQLKTVGRMVRSNLSWLSESSNAKRDNGDGRCVRVVKTPNGERAGGVSFFPDGRTVARGGSDGLLRIIDLFDGSELWVSRRQVSHDGSINDVAVSSDGRRIATTSYDQTVCIWEAFGNIEPIKCEGHTQYGFRVRWSSDEAILATASHDGTIRIWEGTTGKCVQILEGHSGIITGLCWSPDGISIASASADRTVRLWEARTGKEYRRIELTEAAVNSVDWSPDGSRIATGAKDYCLRVWDVASGELSFEPLQGHENDLDDLRWSSCGNLIATTGWYDATIRIWNVHDMRCERTLVFPEQFAWRLSWSPHERLLATTHSGNVMRLWDLRHDHT